MFYRTCPFGLTLLGKTVPLGVENKLGVSALCEMKIRETISIVQMEMFFSYVAKNRCGCLRHKNIKSIPVIYFQVS